MVEDQRYIVCAPEHAIALEQRRAKSFMSHLVPGTWRRRNPPATAWNRPRPPSPDGRKFTAEFIVEEPLKVGPVRPYRRSSAALIFTSHLSIGWLRRYNVLSSLGDEWFAVRPGRHASTRYCFMALAAPLFLSLPTLAQRPTCHRSATTAGQRLSTLRPAPAADRADCGSPLMRYARRVLVASTYAARSDIGGTLGGEDANFKGPALEAAMQGRGMPSVKGLTAVPPVSQ